MWVFGVWLLMSSDPVRERVVTFALQDATQFTSGFSENALGTVERGDSAAVVHARLGEPYYELLVYEDLPDSCIVVRTQSGAVVFTLFADACSRRGVRPGVTRDAVLRALGAPLQRCWLYSRTPDGGYYRARIVCFEQDRVAAVIRRWVKD
jgi:hypothetical protein